MLAAVLLLDVPSDPCCLGRLRKLVGEVIEGPREIAIALRDVTPEEVLAACAIVGMPVYRSRVVREI